MAQPPADRRSPVPALLLLLLPLATLSCGDLEGPSRPEAESTPSADTAGASSAARTPADPGPAEAAPPELGALSGVEASPTLAPPSASPPELEENEGHPPRAIAAESEGPGLTDVGARVVAHRKDDLVWRNRSTGQIVAWLMDGRSRTSDVRVGRVEDP